MTPDQWAAAGIAVSYAVVGLLAADHGHDGIGPGQRDDSDTTRRLP